MECVLINKKQNKRWAICSVLTVNIENGIIKVIDTFADENCFDASEWECACYNAVVCCHCGRKFFFNIDTCDIYNNDFLCDKCLQDYYGYCNECGELNKYSDMNDDFVCKGCEKVI